MGEIAMPDMIASFFDDYPLLWVVYGFSLFIPLVGLLAYCFWPKPVDAAARRKKTDEHTPDDRDAKKKQKSRLEEERPTATQEITAQEESKNTLEQSTGQRDSNSKVETVTFEPQSQVCEPAKDSSRSECPKKPAPPPVASRKKGRTPVIIKDSMQQERTEVLPSVLPRQNEDAPSIKEEAIRPAEEAANPHKVADLVSKFQDNSNNSGNGADPAIKAVNGFDAQQQLRSKAPAHSPLSNQQKEDDPTRQVVTNGWSHQERVEVEVVGPKEQQSREGKDQVFTQEKVCEENGSKRWSFPPKLEEFNLMESDVDPADLENIFTDDRLTAIDLAVEPDGLGLGISIVGGSGSPNGDLPIIIKRILPNSLAEKDEKLKSGDELIAVNDTLLVGMRKDFAIDTLSNIEGPVRLLVLQDD